MTLKKKVLEITVTKEKMLVTSIFSYSHSVSNLSKGEIVILATFNLLSANAFNLVTSKILSFAKGLIKERIFYISVVDTFCTNGGIFYISVVDTFCTNGGIFYISVVDTFCTNGGIFYISVVDTFCNDGRIFYISRHFL